MPAYQSPKPRVRASETSSGALWMAATAPLGSAVGVVGFFALMMWGDARVSRDKAAAQPAATPARR